MQIASALSDGTLEQLLAGPQPPPEELLRDSRLQLGLLAGVLAALPVMLAMWFAPALVVFQDARATTALGASLRAALANWRPILVYALGVFVFGMMLPAVVGQLVVALIPSEITIAVVRFALFAWLLMFGGTLHISDYVSYRDIFHAGETLSPLTARTSARRALDRTSWCCARARTGSIAGCPGLRNSPATRATR